MSSGASTWLHGQRKIELLTIAEKVGLQNYEQLKKPELEVALDEHMRANQASLSKDSTLQAYFRRVIAGEGIETKTPARPRRSTKPKEEPEPTDTSEPETSSKALVTARSPRISLSFASTVPLPPSPSVVANKIDQQTAKVRSSVAEFVRKSGVVETTDGIRDSLSTTAFIQSLAILVELYGMQTDVLPWKSLAVIPLPGSLGISDLPIKVPDLFVLLSSEFWGIFGLWAVTSVALPVMFSYVFNLTLKTKHGGVRHAKHLQPAAQYDPLTYNIAKALVAWLVYAQGVRLSGWVNAESVAKLEAALPGGHHGVLIGAAIGALTSIYEAVLRK